LEKEVKGNFGDEKKLKFGEMKGLGIREKFKALKQ
jgi:hypothetical protein